MPTKDAGMTDLGRRIFNRRRELDLTQEALAKKAGCTKGAVSQWETGDVHNLRLDRLFKVADALHVEARWLAVGEGPKTDVRPASRGKPDKVVRLAERLADLPADEQALLIKIFERTNPPS
jgi:transcriptional regulator with XRE-family HTH domain